VDRRAGVWYRALTRLVRLITPSGPIEKSCLGAASQRDAPAFCLIDESA
jgi:hypothetical protein